MSNDVVLLLQAQAVHSAEEQAVKSGHGLGRRSGLRERAQEADAQGLLVEAGRVQALVVESATLVDRTVVADAEVVRDVRPAEHGGVQHLEVTHLGRAVLEGVADVTGRVVDHYPRRGLGGQDSVRAVRASPFVLGVDGWAH